MVRIVNNAAPLRDLETAIRLLGYLPATTDGIALGSEPMSDEQGVGLLVPGKKHQRVWPGSIWYENRNVWRIDVHGEHHAEAMLAVGNFLEGNFVGSVVLNVVHHTDLEGRKSGLWDRL